jgi:Domain of unknown function (DUF222)
VSGYVSWPGSTAAVPPAPRSVCPWSPPPPGYGTGPAWATPTPTNGSGSPAPCTAAPSQGTAEALADGELSYPHAAALTRATQDLPVGTVTAAEPVLLEAARRLGPPLLRRAVNHLRYVTDPDGAEQQAQRRFERRGLWLSPTWEGMLAVDGLLDPEAGRRCWPPLTPSHAPAALMTSAAAPNATPMR